MDWNNHLTRHEFAQRVLAMNEGAWPDMEGLIRDIYVNLVHPGRCMLDVGVNHGVHLVQMARTVGPAGRVIGFEAVPELVQRTRDAITHHYPDTASQIELHNLAVSDHAGTAQFHYSKANDGGLSGFANRAVLSIGPVETIEVPITTIDEVVDDNFVDRLDFAKFDIEGAEYHAFLGARRVLARQPVLAFEWDRDAPAYFHYQPADLLGLLHAHGYDVYDLFGFSYPDVESLTTAQVWNFVAVPVQRDAKQVLYPSIGTFLANFPDVLNG